ncbi:MAG: response regulator [Chloroflexi bacterium]|nr:response regulator [Chloroflexota bacterium]
MSDLTNDLHSTRHDQTIHQYYHQKFAAAAAHDLEWVATYKAEEFLNLIDHHQPDVIVTELFFPDIHGYDLLKQIKSHPLRSLIPLIVFSKVTNLEDIGRVLGYGVAGFFVKGENTISEVQKLVLSLG